MKLIACMIVLTGFIGLGAAVTGTAEVDGRVAFGVNPDPPPSPPDGPNPPPPPPPDRTV